MTRQIPNNFIFTLYSYRWAPSEEHSRFVTFIYTGNTFGTMITYPIAGMILHWVVDGHGYEVSCYSIAMQ